MVIFKVGQLLSAHHSVLHSALLTVHITADHFAADTEVPIEFESAVSPNIFRCLPIRWLTNPAAVV